MTQSGRTKASNKPTLSYTIYLLTIFTLLVIIVVGVKGTRLNDWCPKKEVPCHVLLNKGQKSPYRNNVHAAYTGWHFAGYAKVKSCWVGYPSFCGYCSNDNYDSRAAACQKKYPGYSSRPAR